VTAFAKGGVLVAIVLVMLLLRHHEPRQILSEEDRAHARALRAIWDAERNVRRCPRAPLREPTIGDGSALLAFDYTAEQACWSHVHALRDEMVPSCKKWPCPRAKLAALRAHPEAIAACASLYRRIEGVAHAREACSPVHADEAFFGLGAILVADAVRIEIVPLLEAGDLGAAAFDVLDAMRFADDLGRKSIASGAMISSSQLERLGETLVEILADPRLSARDARAITLDLDVLIATGPRFQDTLRAEAMWPSEPLGVLVGARRLAYYEEVCTTLEECITRLHTRYEPDDSQRWLDTPLPADVVLEHVIHELNKPGQGNERLEQRSVPGNLRDSVQPVHR